MFKRQGKTDEREEKSRYTDDILRIVKYIIDSEEPEKLTALLLSLAKSDK